MDQIAVEILTSLDDADIAAIAALLPQLSATAKFDPAMLTAAIEHPSEGIVRVI